MKVQKLLLVLAGFTATLTLTAQTHVNKYVLNPFGTPTTNIEWSANTKDPSGKLITTGHTVIAANQIAILTTKFDYSGDTLWQKTWMAVDTGTTMNYGIAITTDASGSIYVAGASAAGGGGLVSPTMPS